MVVILKRPCPTPNLKAEYPQMHQWYNSTLPTINAGNYSTIADFYKDFVEPCLPDTNSVIGWTNLLLEYVNQDNAVFSVRQFANWLKVNNSKGLGSNVYNPYSLRRGFLTEFERSKLKYFFTDNFFAAYFMKMAFDGFVPSIDDLLKEMNNRTFPARFGRYCKEERAVAAFDITGNIAKDPGIKNAGYKIGHVIDSGKAYQAFGVTKDLAGICNHYFPRGNYQDWEPNGQYYRRLVRNLNSDALPYLKAHFLRFACPINYFLAPKPKNNGKIYHEYHVGNTIKYDIAELPDLQEYIIGQFHQLYGKVYEDYLKAIMWQASSQDVESELARIQKHLHSLGTTTINLTVFNPPFTPKGATNTSKPNASKSARKATSNAGSGIGQFAKREIAAKIPNLSANQLNDLQDKGYCKREFNINFPVLSKTRNPKERYYAAKMNGYYICNDWYPKNRAKLEDWLSNN